MGFMDQALSSHQFPTSDDLEIALPTRHEPKKESQAPDAPELGQHGGGADGTPASSESHGDVVASSATSDAAPAPQRDEPDDGEHTDSTEQQVASRAARAASAEEQQSADEAPEHEVGDEQEVAQEDQPDLTAEKPRSVAEILSDTEGASPRTFKRAGFSAGKDVTGIQVKRFPQPAIDKLRTTLALSAGGSFAEAISAASLLTAFVMANTGLELDVDEDTTAAAEAFRENDPRLVEVEDKVGQVLENIDQLAAAMKIGLRRVGDTGKVVDGLEFGVSFLVGDRVTRLATPEIDETNVDIVQRKTLIVRDRMKSQAKQQRTIEKQREGRSNA